MMADVNGIQNYSSVIEKYSHKNNEPEAKSSEKDMFLELMMAQMENQDPLDPQDNGDFLAQLAQFSTVEGIEKLNGSMETFAQGFRSSQALQATALVGRKVQVQGNETFMDGINGMEGSVNLPSSTGDLKLHIFDSSGSLVRTVDHGSAEAGDIGFSWDGTDNAGNALPAGRYRIEATASQADGVEQMQTFVYANVNSVTVGGTGEVTLNVEDVGPVALSDVRQIQ